MTPKEEKIDEAISDLKLHLNNNKEKRMILISVINEQERQLEVLEIINNKE